MYEGLEICLSRHQYIQGFEVPLLVLFTTNLKGSHNENMYASTTVTKNRSKRQSLKKEEKRKRLFDKHEANFLSCLRIM